MALFKRGSKAPSGANSKPMTGGVPKGGYGSHGTPHKAMRTSAIKSKPSGGHKGTPAHKPKGGHGTYGKPNPKAPKSQQSLRDYASDNMATPKTPIPKDQNTGRFNMPKGKFTY